MFVFFLSLQCFVTLAIAGEFSSEEAITSRSAEQLEEPLPLPKSERIITDYEDVLNGVYISYSYNDTSEFAPGEGLPSVPGCPKNENGLPWVLYRPHSLLTALNRCYLAGQRGPCELGQKLFVERGSPFGYCNCACFEGIDIDYSSREMFCSPQLTTIKCVFYTDIKKCYALYDQGPCKDNEWLVEVPEAEKRPTGTAPRTKCEDRKCPKGKLPVLLPDSEDANKVTLECVYPSKSATYGYVHSVAGNECGPNMKYSSLLKKCTKRAFSF
jgi:hypothetical protein